ncbi:MAG: thiolase family protein [Thermoplasmata archaeon]
MTVVTVASWGLTSWGDRAEGLVDLLAEAGSVALEGVGRKPIDLLIVGSTGIGESADGSLVLPQVSDRLGIDTGAAVRVESGTATGAAAFHSAVEAVRSGDVERVLVVAAEKRPPAARDPTSAWMEPWLAPSERAAGATAPALAALIAQRYLTRFATGPEVFDEIVTRARERASPSPRDPKPVGDPGRTLEQSPWVAPPLRAAHCAVRGDGAAAIVVERGAGRVIVRGIGQGLDVQAVSERADLTSFRASRLAGQRAMAGARLPGSRADFVEVYDAYAPLVCLAIEDLGVCQPGEAPTWLGNHDGTSEGARSVNPSGGLLGSGDPIAASGLVGIVHVARQLAGEAGSQQLPRAARTGLAHSLGGLGAQALVTILARSGKR